MTGEYTKGGLLGELAVCMTMTLICFVATVDTPECWREGGRGVIRGGGGVWEG